MLPSLLVVFRLASSECMRGFPRRLYMCHVPAGAFGGTKLSDFFTFLPVMGKKLKFIFLDNC